MLFRSDFGQVLSDDPADRDYGLVADDFHLARLTEHHLKHIVDGIRVGFCSDVDVGDGLKVRLGAHQVDLHRATALECVEKVLHWFEKNKKFYFKNEKDMTLFILKFCS